MCISARTHIYTIEKLRTINKLFVALCGVSAKADS